MIIEHMRHATIQTLKDEDFKRSTGVSHAMFEKMLKVVKAGLRDFGRTPKLIREDQFDCSYLQSRTQNDQQIGFCKRSNKSIKLLSA
jgi:hypothetical protein